MELKTALAGVIIPLLIFVSSASGLTCKEHHCESIVGIDSGSLRLDGGRSTLYANISDGYVVITNGTGTVGYVCDTDEKTKQLQGNAICRTLGFERAYDIPTDNRYGKPPETLQSYKLNCTNGDSPCVLEKTDECSPENVLSVWCITDYSVRLIDDDKGMLLDNGFFVYYYNFTWWKVRPATANFELLCMEYGFDEKIKHEHKNGPIPAEADYAFGDKEFECDKDKKNCNWKLLEKDADRPYWVECAGGTAQTIINRIMEQSNGTTPPTALTTGNIPDLPSTAASPKTPGNQVDPDNQTTADMVAISIGSTLLVVLIVILLSVLFLKRQRLIRYIQVQRTQDTANTEGNEVVLNCHQDVEKTQSV